MFRRLVLPVSLAAALAALCATFAALDPVAAAGPEPAPLQGSLCQPYLSQEVHPQLLLLGETTTVTVTFGAVCPSRAYPVHLVMVLDASAAMQGEPGRQLRQKAAGLLQWLELPEIASTQVGVVAFNSRAKVLAQLTNDEDKLLASLGRLGSSGGGDIEHGIVEGLQLLERGRRGASPWKRPVDVLVLFTDGERESGCSAAVAAAERGARDGVTTFTVPATRNADKRCLQEIAPTPRRHLDGRDPWERLWIYTYGYCYLSDGITHLTLTQALPANMDIVDGTVNPPAQVSPDRKAISWIHRQARMPYTFSYRLRPLQAGSHPTGLETRADFIDYVGAGGSVTASSAEVMVLAPRP